MSDLQNCSVFRWLHSGFRLGVLGSLSLVQSMLHLVFYSCSSTLDLSFFMMLLSICEPLLCDIDPSWWSRHIDFQVYTIKLQPRFCHAHVSQWNSHFWTNFWYDVLCNFAIATLSPLCFVCESTHRLRDLLSSLQICEPVVHDILKKTFSDLWNCVHFCVRPLSELQNCGESRQLHPVTWAGALKIRFWGLSPKWYFSITLLLAT